MPPPRQTKIDFLDFAKGYAILTIVLYHILQRMDLAPLWQKAIVFGGSGVHLFFLLSGFGLALSAARATTTGTGTRGVFDFYRRRALKVWLPYVLILTISLFAAMAFHLFPDRWGAWLAGVGLYQMFSEPYIQAFGGHFWFISAIIQFYIAWPFLAWLKRRFQNPAGFFLFCLLISILWWVLVWALGKGEYRTWNSFFLQFLWEFALGMVLVGGLPAFALRASAGKKDSYLAFWNFSWWIYLALGILFTAIMIVMIQKLGETGRIFNDIPALIGYSAWCILLSQIGEKWAPALNRFFIWVGRFSFSLYLAHILVLDFLLLILEMNGLAFNWIWLLLYLPLALAGGRVFEALSRWWVGLFETT